MKKVLIVVGILVGAFAAIIGGSWLGTGAARAQGEKFVAAIHAGDEAALGDMMSRELKEKLEPAKLLRMARGWGLDAAERVSWREWSIGTDGAKLSGAAVRTDGREQSLDMTLFKQEGAWKVNKIATQPLDVVSDPMALSVPEPAELVAMAAQVTRDVGLGVREGSLKAVHASASHLLQTALTVAELDTAFAQMIDNHIDVGPAADLEPVFDPAPNIGPDGRLVAAGHYPSRPAQVDFHYSFVREQDQWRLVSLNVKTVKPD